MATTSPKFKSHLTYTKSHIITENKLFKSAPTTSNIMNVTSYRHEESHLGTAVLSQSNHGILTCEGNIVRWVNTQGNRIVKQFSCSTKPLGAVFMQNYYQNDFQGGPSVAILVSQTLVRIFTFSGQIFETALSFFACKLHSTSFGIVIERNMSIGSQLFSNSDDCMLYVLSSPAEPLRPVLGCDIDTVFSRSYNVVCVSGRIVLFHSSTSRGVHLFSLEEADIGETTLLGTSFISVENSADSFTGGNPNLDNQVTSQNTTFGVISSEDIPSTGSPDNNRWRYSKKGRNTSFAGKNAKSVVGNSHTTRQQDLATALGVSGISGDGRSVSPYRGSSDPLHSYPILVDRSGSGGSIAVSSVLSSASMTMSMAEHNESSVTLKDLDSFGNGALYNSAISDFTNPFVLKHYGFVSLRGCNEENVSANSEVNASEFDISFSQSPQGDFLMHVLDQRKKTLRTYVCTTPTTGYDPSQIVCDHLTSGNIREARCLRDVQCATHISLGNLPVSGMLLKYKTHNSLFATLVVSAKVCVIHGSC